MTMPRSLGPRYSWLRQSGLVPFNHVPKQREPYVQERIPTHTEISPAEPEVRIHLPPARSQVRTRLPSPFATGTDLLVRVPARWERAERTMPIRCPPQNATRASRVAWAGVRPRISSSRCATISTRSTARASVVVERVRDDEMWPAVIVGPIGQLVIVRRRCHKGTRLPQRMLGDLVAVGRSRHGRGAGCDRRNGQTRRRAPACRRDGNAERRSSSSASARGVIMNGKDGARVRDAQGMIAH
jgi:hypothetical protein